MQFRKYTIFGCAFFLSFLLFQTTSCKKDASLPPIDNNKDLDGTLINDSSLIDPANCLLSSAIPNPPDSVKNTNVIICVHGYSATTFEWLEFRDWARSNGGFLVSRVLLGGHGRDYADFKKATWQDWQQPILDEYNKLVAIGYKRIHVFASSTGGTLLLNAIRTGKIKGDALKSIALIDPLIIPGNKQISLIPAISKVTPYVEGEIEQGEGGFWYKYRPSESLKQLEIVERQERKALETGYSLPAGVKGSVYKSIHDGAVDPASAVQLKNGLKLADGSEITINMINSSLHVFTRLKGRNVITDDDRYLQVTTFENLRNGLY